jgi:5-dehydro-2-deoxygluconokinase
MQTLDVITIGRSSVDLYGAQIGGRLEDMGSFEKYIGGSPTNIACGTARLGLTSAVITAVGDEHMGRFIIEQLAREGVDTRGVKVDPKRLTALVILGIRDREHFPLIFYRENCADMALCEDDIEEDLVRSARSVVVTGTHLSNAGTEAAVLKALRIAREAGIKTALDIDYRPNLWGVAGHGEGESRFVESAKVTAKLQEPAPLRPHRRNRRGASHRRRLNRHGDGAEGRARCLGRHPRRQAWRAWRCRLRRIHHGQP